MITRQRYDLFFSVYLSARGFGFVVAEGPQNPIDWGTVEHRGPEKNRKCLASIAELVHRYRPDILILEDTNHPASLRVKRIRDLSAQLCTFAQDHGIPVQTVSRDDIRLAFAPHGAETKDEIAEVIGERLPMLLRYVPPVRKPWMSEAAGMALIDAAALLLTAASQGNGTASS